MNFKIVNYLQSIFFFYLQSNFLVRVTILSDTRSKMGILCVDQTLFKKGISNKDSETTIKVCSQKGQCKEDDGESEHNIK